MHKPHDIGCKLIMEKYMYIIIIVCIYNGDSIEDLQEVGI